jgi:hypothetical protein
MILKVEPKAPDVSKMPRLCSVSGNLAREDLFLTNTIANQDWSIRLSVRKYPLLAGRLHCGKADSIPRRIVFERSMPESGFSLQDAVQPSAGRDRHACCLAAQPL